MKSRFSNELHKYLIISVWYEQRSVLKKVKLPKGFDFHPCALNMLNEFGNLDIGDKKKSKGIVAAKNTVQIQPSLAMGEEKLIQHFSKLLGVKLCPLGEIDEGFFFLAVAENGSIHILGQDIYLVGKDFDHASETLLKGSEIYAIEIG